MAEVFKRVSEDSMGMILQISEKGVFMDVKQVLLHEGRRAMFKFHHVWYLMILNMGKGNRIELDRALQEFIIAEAKISRATFYKIVKAMADSKLTTKGEKRGIYKLNGLKKHKINE